MSGANDPAALTDAELAAAVAVEVMGYLEAVIACNGWNPIHNWRDAGAVLEKARLGVLPDGPDWQSHTRASEPIFAVYTDTNPRRAICVAAVRAARAKGSAADG